MTDPALTRRLARLELTNRLWNLLALTGFGLWLLASGAPPREETVAAERFELVDAEGRVRAEMGLDADGSAGFFVRDPEGGLRAALIHDEAQSALYLIDGEGTIRVGAAQYAHGGGGIALHGAQSRGGAVRYLKEGEGSLTFYEAEGTVRARLPD